MIYRALFERALRQRIEAGGSVEQMVRLVNAYQGSDLLARQEEFSQWLLRERFDCARCGSTCLAQATHTEEDEPLCQGCLAGYFIWSREPMVGWNRTWSR